MTLNRRTFVQAAAALTALDATQVFAADTVKIGYVSPQTGPLAPFGEADKWVIDQMKAAFKGGLAIGGKKYDGADPAQGQPVGESEPRQRSGHST